jgi:ribulose-5-phosphate 4-epimerase/fuculose-1-phosphate aldolase
MLLSLGAILSCILILTNRWALNGRLLLARAANQWCTPYVQIYLVDLSTVQRSMSEIPYFILVVFPGIVPLMQPMALVSFVFLVATRMAVGQKL